MGIDEVLRRVRFLLHRRRNETELREEMLLHRELRARQLVNEGIKPDDAEAAAARLAAVDAVVRDQE